jgi:cytochrome c oxidase subunit 3
LVFAAEQGDVYGLRRWYALTFLLGAIFLGGQVGEYWQLVNVHHTTISSSAWARCSL